MSTIRQLKEALVARNQDYGDVAELADKLEKENNESALRNELEWLRRWTQPPEMTEVETAKAIYEAWRDEHCQRAYELLRAHHERTAGRYANAHFAAIMVDLLNKELNQLRHTQKGTQ